MERLHKLPFAVRSLQLNSDQLGPGQGEFAFTLKETPLES